MLFNIVRIRLLGSVVYQRDVSRSCQFTCCHSNASNATRGKQCDFEHMKYDSSFAVLKN